MGHNEDWVVGREGDLLETIIFSILKSCVFFSFSVLTDGLKDNFGNVEVNVLECPDLRQPPFHLAAEGIYEACYLSHIHVTSKNSESRHSCSLLSLIRALLFTSYILKFSLIEETKISIELLWHYHA